MAEIVIHHDERMDCSGYPLGLSGEDILLEASMTGVGVVVEAMSSHRPYRPSICVDKALEEISEDRAARHDPQGSTPGGF